MKKLMTFLFGATPKKPIDWKTDPETWAAHAAITCALALVSHFAFSNPWFGYGLGVGGYYVKEWFEDGRNSYFPWRWESWDSILDFASPAIIGFLFCWSLV